MELTGLKSGTDIRGTASGKNIELTDKNVKKNNVGLS